MSDATPVGRHRVDNRRRWLTILGVAVVAAAILYALYYFLYAQYYQSTDDAYVGGDIVAITSREPGTVLALHADNTQAVRHGQLLIELDPVKARVALEAAEADLAQTVRAVRTNFSKVDQYRAQLAATHVAQAQAESDWRRRAGAGAAVSHEELAHAHDALTSAEANVRVAEAGLAQALASVQHTTVGDNPDVLAAMARLRQAAIVNSHMLIRAPVDGVVAQRSAQLGQQIAAGAPLMAVVPLNDVWVDANFKEGQLKYMRVGQPATVTADIYGGGVTYHGHILGVGAGSGSAFALLPPQNASGNWIKIVQRVPVRIVLDPEDLRKHPLRIGLSVNASIDIADTSGSAVGSTVPARTLRDNSVDDGSAEADALIRRILRQNGA